jgi:hypothetical protein
MLPKAIVPDEKNPDLSSIILKSVVQFDDAKIKNLLKSIEVKDKVLISGKFKTNIANGVNFSGYISEKPDFSNPQFDFDLTDIKKIN